MRLGFLWLFVILVTRAGTAFKLNCGEFLRHGQSPFFAVRVTADRTSRVSGSRH
jgi:hypothetical protein